MDVNKRSYSSIVVRSPLSGCQDRTDNHPTGENVNYLPTSDLSRMAFLAMTAAQPLVPNLQLPIGGTTLQRRIADAAIELFYRNGATATSVRDITAACGLSPGALYNHFSSKE